jgi:hypothetical protein
MSGGVQRKMAETGEKWSEENNNRFEQLFEQAPKFGFCSKILRQRMLD